MDVEAQRATQRSYFALWLDGLRARQEFRAKSRLADALRRAHDRAALVGMMRSVVRGVEQMRQVQRRRAALQVLMATTSRQVMLDAYHRWQAECHARRAHRSALLRAGVMERINVEQNLRRRYYDAWRAAIGRRARIAAAMKRAVVQQRGYDTRLLSAYYLTWMRAVAELRQRKLRERTVGVLSDHKDRLCASSFFGKWRRFTSERTAAARQSELAGLESDVMGLRAKLQALEHLARRKKLLDDALKLVADAKATVEKLRAQQAKERSDMDELRTLIADKRANARAKQEKTIAQQVDDLIAMLKSKTLNLHYDYVLIQKVLQRTETIPAQNVFLEAHQGVKRHVVAWTGESHLPSDREWPLSEELIAEKLQKHEVDVILTSIKTMVITFDIMTPAQRNSLSTDVEIQVNAKWVGYLVDRCNDMRAARLGAVANHVRK
jgi:hypothetical protein